MNFIVFIMCSQTTNYKCGCIVIKYPKQCRCINKGIYISIFDPNKCSSCKTPNLSSTNTSRNSSMSP